MGKQKDQKGEMIWIKPWFGSQMAKFEKKNPSSD